MRIIVWDDPLEPTTGVAEVARLLAGRLGDSVNLFAPADDAGRTDGIKSGMGKRSTATIATELGGETTRAGGALTVPVAASFSTNAPEEWINTTAAATRVRLVVVPWAEPATSSAWRRESAAERIALNASVPTLVVRDSAPLAAWAGGHRPLRVLVAHDLTKTADDALAFLKQFTELERCEIVVAHVHDPVEEGARLGLGTLPAGECEIEVRQTLQRNLEDRVHRVIGATPAEIRVCPTTLRRDTAVLDLARQQSFDLVVAGTHQRHGIDRIGHPGSLSRALLRSAPRNVLLVPLVRTVSPSPGGVTRVLVATDLSWASNQAVPHGYALLPHGGTLRLLHVVHPRALPDGEFDQGISRHAAHARHMEVLHDCKARLHAIALGGDDAPGVTTEVEVVEHAEPAVAIAQSAERFGADVVCMASHRPDSVFGRLFKTHIQAVMAKSSRTLLIVHPAST